MYFSRCKNNRAKKPKGQSIVSKSLLINLGDHACRVSPCNINTSITILVSKIQNYSSTIHWELVLITFVTTTKNGKSHCVLLHMQRLLSTREEDKASCFSITSNRPVLI